MLDKLRLFSFSKKSLYNVSEEPGIYIFYNSFKKPIYIGKAINLRKRLYSYTLRNLEPKTMLMVSKAMYFSFIKVSSEVEALLLEAKLVSSLKPKYNIQLKDDKSPLYIVITNELYPRILTLRFPDKKVYKSLAIFGPFLTSENVYFILKNIRRIFPYSTHKPEGKVCFYSHLKLCNPCPSRIETCENMEKVNLRNKYLSNIKHIIKFLKGDVSLLTDDLNREMQNYSKDTEFEKAKDIKTKIDKIKSITYPIISGEHFIENPNLREDLRNKELLSLGLVLDSHFLVKKVKNYVLRCIECYDIAHLNGKYPVASMVTFYDGNPDKSKYRHFKILQSNSMSDVGSMFEVGKRRSKYFTKWGIPDLVLADGGKSQVTTMQRIFEVYNIPVIGISKMSNSLVIPIYKRGEQNYIFKVVNLHNKKYFPLIIRLKDEAHRFSRKLHHKLLNKSYYI